MKARQQEAQVRAATERKDASLQAACSGSQAWKATATRTAANALLHPWGQLLLSSSDTADNWGTGLLPNLSKVKHSWQTQPAIWIKEIWLQSLPS